MKQITSRGCNYIHVFVDFNNAHLGHIRRDSLVNPSPSSEFKVDISQSQQIPDDARHTQKMPLKRAEWDGDGGGLVVLYVQQMFWCGDCV